MPLRNATLHQDWFPRHRASSPTLEPFVPIGSSVEAIRQILGQLERESRVVVLYGPHGTGRSTIARRVCSLWPGSVTFLTQPPKACDPDFVFASDPRDQSRSRSRGESLRVIDALTLDHSDWSVRIAENLPPRQKLLIVSSTAWWLEFGRYLPIRVAGVATKWLDHEEIAHLINAKRWMRNPNAPAVESEYVAKIAAASEGRLSEIIRMAGDAHDRLR